jgi:hypothetical protein
MKRLLYTLGVIAGLAALSCQPTQRVQAANEDERLDQEQNDHTIRGDLYSVDLNDKRMVIRVENGMAQTFRWDDDTLFDGALPLQDGKSQNAAPETISVDTVSMMKRLMRCRGSDVSVEWTDSNDEKMATVIHISDLIVSTPPRHRRTRSQTR